MLETKGHDDRTDVKTQAAERWVRAVNADGSYGEWRYAISRDTNEIPSLIEEHARRDFRPDDSVEAEQPPR